MQIILVDISNMDIKKWIINEIKTALDEAAPRMRKDPDVDQLLSILKDVSRIENGMKARDRSRHSHVKRDFKKFYDALINLKGTLSTKGPTIPENSKY